MFGLSSLPVSSLLFCSGFISTKEIFGFSSVAEARKLAQEAETCRPLDSDGDGVTDDLDQCPGTPRGVKVDARGCWIIKDVLFDFDKSVIKPQAYPILEEVVAVLKRNPSVKVEIQGHTDSVGMAQYNRGLSERRANAVMKYLVKKGVAGNRLTAVGYGLTRPIASNLWQGYGVGRHGARPHCIFN